MFIKGWINGRGVVRLPEAAVVFCHVTRNAGIGDPIYKHAIAQHTREDEKADSEIAKNIRAYRRARGLGHLALATERDIAMRIITYGTVVENQKTGTTAAPTVAARNSRASGWT